MFECVHAPFLGRVLDRVLGSVETGGGLVAWDADAIEGLGFEPVDCFGCRLVNAVIRACGERAAVASRGGASAEAALLTPRDGCIELLFVTVHASGVDSCSVFIRQLC